MSLTYCLPFKVDQLAESKSFMIGFRGAWFRCKINGISLKQGQIAYALEYFDFPDEKIKWTQVYQKPLTKRHDKKQLIVRPRYPHICHGDMVPDPCTISEPVVVFSNAWDVGDLVDWWSNDCYWSGRVTMLVGDDKVQIELPAPPVGEGMSYEALCRDLRPSLDWSPEHGWSIPISEVNSASCASLILPSHSEREKTTYTVQNVDMPGSKVESPLSLYKTPSVVNHGDEDCKIQEAYFGARNLCSYDGGEDSVESSKSDDEHCSSVTYPKKMKVSENETMCTVEPNTIDSCIMDLEELVNKIKWLNEVLQFGFRSASEMKPSWEFLEHSGQLHQVNSLKKEV